MVAPAAAPDHSSSHIHQTTKLLLQAGTPPVNLGVAGYERAAAAAAAVVGAAAAVATVII